jgi:GTP cyclohydrolase II
MAGITVVQVHNHCLFSDLLNTLKYKCGQDVDFLKLHLILGQVTTGLQMVKSFVLLSSK